MNFGLEMQVGARPSPYHSGSPAPFLTVRYVPLCATVQAIGRINRIGQKVPPTIERILVEVRRAISTIS